MPHVSIHTMKQPDIDKKRQLVKKLTQVVSEVYGVPEAAVTVELWENEPENVAHGGTLLADGRH